MSTTRNAVLQLRETISARRAARLDRQRLIRELATYTTPADRAELGAIISRHTPEETSELELLLGSRAA
jgi:hypothetical protein